MSLQPRTSQKQDQEYTQEYAQQLPLRVRVDEYYENMSQYLDCIVWYRDSELLAINYVAGNKFRLHMHDGTSHNVEGYALLYLYKKVHHVRWLFICLLICAISIVSLLYFPPLPYIDLIGMFR